ncbi:MAG: hypothetical protein JNK82_31375 [Myxococcaceae bacterium]|nr:hypothetical protein [Myxococcaceae bacterium]
MPARPTVGVLLLAGCATLLGPPVVRWADPPSKKREGSVLARRDECLKPPFTLPPGQSLTPEGMRIDPRGDGPREVTIAFGNGAPLEADAVLALQSRVQAKLLAIDGVEQLGLSGCISGGKQRPCLSLQVELCSQPIDGLARQLKAIIEADSGSRGRAIVLHVALTGAAGPRCEADDPRCRPEPYASGLYRSGERRGLVKASQGEPECASDGECGRSSCGGDCVPWPQAHRPGTCAADASLGSAFCGCVERRCAWFVQ